MNTFQRAIARLTGIPLDVRRYEGASKGRRTQHWLARQESADAAIVESAQTLRDRSRDLVANNPYAAKALASISAHVVGRGIKAQFRRANSIDSAMTESWVRFSSTPMIDANGVFDFAGLQRIAIRSVVESGDCLGVRMRGASPEAPFSVRLLEPDYLDNSQDTESLAGGGRIVNGIEYDGNGRVTAYWLFQDHPGGLSGDQTVVRTPATDVLHVYRVDRPGQSLGVPWLSPVMIRLRDFDEFEDAYLFRQKLANCHVAFVTDPDPNAGYEADMVDSLEPGAVEILPPGKSVTFNDPPQADGSEQYRKVTLHSVAAGLGISYEALTGDYSQVNFSSGRMGHLEYQRNIANWQYQMMIPQFCDTLARWYMEGMGISTESVTDVSVGWTPPRREMVDPQKEIPPLRDAVRAGFMTPQEAARSMGYEPERLYQEWAQAADIFDSLGLVFDTDPRKATQQGLAQNVPNEDSNDVSQS